MRKTTLKHFFFFAW